MVTEEVSSNEELFSEFNHPNKNCKKYLSADIKLEALMIRYS